MKKPDLYWHAQKICSISQFEIVIVRDPNDSQNTLSVTSMWNVNRRYHFLS
jgi:hypothetical protein